MLDRAYFNYLSSSVISLLSIHFILSFFIGDSYTYTRIISNTIFSITILFLLFKYTDLLINSFLKNKFLFAFLFIPIIQIFTSSFINTKAEIYQHTLISITYFIVFLLTIFFSENLNYISLKKFFNTFLLLNIILFSFLFIYYFIFLDHITLKYTIKRFFSNIRYLNHLQTLFIPILLFYFSFIKCLRTKILITLLLVINFNLLFYTGARGSIYAISISSVIILFFSDKKLKKDLIFFITIFLISFIIFQMISISDTNVTHLNSFSSSGRMQIYETLFPYLLKYIHIFDAIGFASQDTAIYNFLHPHNLLLYVFLGGGSFFLILFIIALSIYLKNIYITYSKKRTRVQTYLIFILSSILIHSMVSGLYITPLTLTICIYFFIFFNKQLINYSLKRKTYFPKKILKLVIILLISVLISSNLIYLYRTYKISSEYIYTEEELKNKYNNIRKIVPGILLFELKIIEKK